MDNPFAKRPRPGNRSEALMPLKMAMDVLHDVAHIQRGERISESGVEAAWIVGKALEFTLTALSDAGREPCLHLELNGGKPCDGFPPDDVDDLPKPYDVDGWCSVCICNATLARLNGGI
jgi:hypothetical protein